MSKKTKGEDVTTGLATDRVEQWKEAVRADLSAPSPEFKQEVEAASDLPVTWVNHHVEDAVAEVATRVVLNCHDCDELRNARGDKADRLLVFCRVHSVG